MKADRRSPERRPRQAGELIGNGPAAGDQRDAGNGLEQGAVIDAHQVGAKRVDRTSSELFAEMGPRLTAPRSEEHTSELQSLMRISYAVFCLKKKTTINKMKNA